MRLLHVPFNYFPSPCGGTEIYASALCRELAQEGVMNIIAAPASSASSYLHEGMDVHRFAVHSAPALDTIYSGGDPVAAAAFGGVLDQTSPDLIHFHARSPAVSHLALREARQRGIRTVFTYHTPTASCPRGSLMRWGRQPCDGKLRSGLCAACQLQGMGLAKPVAQLAAALSPVTRHLSRWLPAAARWQVPARARWLTARRHETTEEWFNGMDRIVALNAWTRRLLLINGVPADRVRTVRHGLTQESSVYPRLPRPPRTGSQPLRLVFLGRLHPMKGMDVVLDALALVPEVSIELDAYTIVEENSGPRALALQQRMAGDRRVRICTPVSPADVIATLSSYDALLVPSQWLETGPLVVLEAFAAGLPVLGSNLGGIAEWVTHERDGLLLPHNEAGAWASAFQRLANDPGLLAMLHQNICPPRSMREVALEMLDIYRELLPSP